MSYEFEKLLKKETRIIATCSICGEERSTSLLDAKVFANYLTSFGWILYDKHLFCPKCVKYIPD